jgi:hypothetical protein
VLQIECPNDVARQQQVERPTAELSRALERPIEIEIAPIAIELLNQATTIAKPASVDTGGDRQVLRQVACCKPRSVGSDGRA